MPASHVKPCVRRQKNDARMPGRSARQWRGRLGRISKQGDSYLRRLLVVGTHAVLRFSRNGKTAPTRWLLASASDPCEFAASSVSGFQPATHLMVALYLMMKGFTGGVLLVEIQTLFVVRNSWIDFAPLSRPMPDFFTPPKGII